jgi:translation initiation factor 2 subunit 3
MEHNIDLNKQPLVIISTQGSVANGKTSIIKCLTKKSLMRFKKEAENNMTIKLGYTNAKIMKCIKCPEPFCYQINNLKCNQCEEDTELKLNISFIDSPGHNDLQATALSGASTMDYCLLLVSTDNELENKGDEYVNEHYKTIKFLDLIDKTVILQNKIDLVTKEKALEQFRTIKNKYEIKNVIPISAQYEYNINYLLQFLVEKIPHPINTDLIHKINLPLKGTVIRSFDVNKKSIAVEDINCAVIGGTIRTGMIKIGDKIKLLPGITKNNKIIPLKGRVLSLKTDEIELTEAYPGGLIGIGLSIDPLLSKEDRLVGNIIIKDEDESVKTFVKADVSYEIYDNIDIKENENVSVMLYSLRRTAELVNLNKQNKTLTFESKLQFAGELNDNVVILKNNKICLFGKITKIY